MLISIFATESGGWDGQAVQHGFRGAGSFGPKGPTPSRRIDQVRPQQLNAKMASRIDLG